MVLCFPSTDNNADEDTSRKPSESKFKQQKLKAWQPILTASTILPVFFTIGVLFIPIGIGLLATSNKIKEKVIEYSTHPNCNHCKEYLVKNLDDFKEGIKTNCKCHISFSLKEKWEGDVYFYYGLTNFYQNHRRYVRSRDDNQIHGELSKAVNTNCKPFQKMKNSSKTVVPCGAIANSMFSDVFSLMSKKNGQVGMTYENIAWKSDREVKFRNPKNTGDNKKLKEAFKGFAKPQFWTKPIYELDMNDIKNNGFDNQDFIVWMRVAAFPTFRKLYRKLNHTSAGFGSGLPADTYNLTINYNFPVEQFKGKKRFILTTISWMGGKNPFLGIAYIIVGCICLIFGFIFLAIHLKVRSRGGVDNTH